MERMIDKINGLRAIFAPTNAMTGIAFKFVNCNLRKSTLRYLSERSSGYIS